MTFFRDIYWNDHKIITQSLDQGAIVKCQMFLPGNIRPFTYGGFKVLDPDTLGFWTSKDIIRRNGPENKSIDYEIIRGINLGDRFEVEAPFGFSIDYRWEPTAPSREISRR